MMKKPNATNLRFAMKKPMPTRMLTIEGTKKAMAYTSASVEMPSIIVMKALAIPTAIAHPMPLASSEELIFGSPGSKLCKTKPPKQKR